jgi:hypothetical protein
MNGGTKSGVSAISLERLQCVRRDSAGPTELKKKKKKKRRRRRRPVSEDRFLHAIVN